MMYLENSQEMVNRETGSLSKGSGRPLLSPGIQNPPLQTFQHCTHSARSTCADSAAMMFLITTIWSHY